MRFAAMLLFGLMACSPRVEVELHPEEGDKSIIIVIEDNEGLRAFGQNLDGGEENSLTRRLAPEARVVILYYGELLEAHGLSPGEIEQQSKLEFGVPLPLVPQPGFQSTL